MNGRNQRVIVTVAIWLPTLLLLFANPFRSSPDFAQTMAILLPIIATAGTVYLWTKKPPHSSSRE